MLGLHYIFPDYYTIIGTLIDVHRFVKTIPLPEKGPKRPLKIAVIILNCYTEFFRRTPMIVQAMVIYYGTALMFGINLDATFAAIFIKMINTGAYIVRNRSWWDYLYRPRDNLKPAKLIGMTHWQTMRYVVFPQYL